jgi:hypothetical protein
VESPTPDESSVWTPSPEKADDFQTCTKKKGAGEEFADAPAKMRISCQEDEPFRLRDDASGRGILGRLTPSHEFLLHTFIISEDDRMLVFEVRSTKLEETLSTTSKD